MKNFPFHLLFCQYTIKPSLLEVSYTFEVKVESAGGEYVYCSNFQLFFFFLYLRLFVSRIRYTNTCHYAPTVIYSDY